ncbi:MAG: STAS domain-containing protein [Thermoguttaceae bacterium]|nr:STAS domain-containing protein [Thermoguttaceae bacterium]
MGISNARTVTRYEKTSAVVDCLDSKLNEELTIQAWGEELGNVLDSIPKNCDRLVVNFRNVQFMSSSALRVLITLNTKARVKKVTLFLCAINANILEVFKITKLDSIFQIRPTENEAVNSMIK